MKIKTSELIGESLNYAVALIEYGTKKLYINPDIRRKGIWVIPQKNGGKNHFHPSKSWAQGGALIEREQISIWPEAHDGAIGTERSTRWLATIYYNGGEQYALESPAPTALIAAMRCYVASKLGDEVEVPDELA